MVKDINEARKIGRNLSPQKGRIPFIPTTNKASVHKMILYGKALNAHLYGRNSRTSVAAHPTSPNSKGKNSNGVAENIKRKQLPVFIERFLSYLQFDCETKFEAGRVSKYLSSWINSRQTKARAGNLTTIFGVETRWNFPSYCKSKEIQWQCHISPF